MKRPRRENDLQPPDPRNSRRREKFAASESTPAPSRPPGAPERSAEPRSGPASPDVASQGPAVTTDKEALIEQFLRSDSRERRAILRTLRPQLGASDVARLAPAVRDSSPKISARITSLLARFGLRAAFEAQLAGLKPGKVLILRHQFDRISSEEAAGEVS